MGESSIAVIFLMLTLFITIIGGCINEEGLEEASQKDYEEGFDDGFGVGYESAVVDIYGGWIGEHFEPGKTYIIKFEEIDFQSEKAKKLMEQQGTLLHIPGEDTKKLGSISNKLEMIPGVLYEVDETGQIWKVDR